MPGSRPHVLPPKKNNRKSQAMKPGFPCTRNRSNIEPIPGGSGENLGSKGRYSESVNLMILDCWENNLYLLKAHTRAENSLSYIIIRDSRLVSR